MLGTKSPGRTRGGSCEPFPMAVAELWCLKYAERLRPQRAWRTAGNGAVVPVHYSVLFAFDRSAGNESEHSVSDLQCVALTSASTFSRWPAVPPQAGSGWRPFPCPLDVEKPHGGVVEAVDFVSTSRSGPLLCVETRSFSCSAARKLSRLPGRPVRILVLHSSVAASLQATDALDWSSRLPGASPAARRRGCASHRAPSLRSGSRPLLTGFHPSLYERPPRLRRLSRALTDRVGCSSTSGLVAA